MDVDCAADPTAVTHVVHIDSRDRDYGTFASSNSYSVRLPRKYKHVLSARLLGCELPNTFLVFSAAQGNTSLDIIYIGTPYTITIPDGTYTRTTLCTHLANALKTATGKTIAVDLGAEDMRLTVTSDRADHTISFDTTGVTSPYPIDWGLGYFLGLEKGKLTTSVAGVLTPPGIVSVKPHTYVFLSIDELNRVETGGTYGIEIGPKTFAKVHLPGDAFEYVFTGKDALHQMHVGHVHYRPPLDKLDRLAISFTFHDGRTVDWRGAEHSFSLELVCRIEREPRAPVSKVTPPNPPALLAATTNHHYQNNMVTLPPPPPLAGWWTGKRWWWFLGVVGALVGWVVFKNTRS